MKVSKPFIGSTAIMHDTSLSRMPTMGEESIEGQGGESGFSLRRNSRNNQNSQTAHKQTT